MGSRLLKLLLLSSLALVVSCGDDSDAADASPSDAATDSMPIIDASSAVTIECGALECALASQYCSATFLVGDGGTTAYECKSLPPACLTTTDPDCSCIDIAGCQCDEFPENAFTLSCVP